MPPQVLPAGRRFPGQGDIAGFAFSGGRLLVGDASNRAIAYDQADLCSRAASIGPAMTTAEICLLLRRPAAACRVAQAAALG